MYAYHSILNITYKQDAKLFDTSHTFVVVKDDSKTKEMSLSNVVT